MKIVLLSGGSGKRLWPLSNEARSKQFLKLLKNDSAEIESMVQRVYRQIKESGIIADVIIATGITQVDSIKGQLGNLVDIVVEPERRDTFPAIALSCAYLADQKKVDLDESVIVLPVDPYADNGYFELLGKMDELVQKNIAQMILMGISPTYPSEKYGYLMVKNGDDILSVTKFREKPSKVEAISLIAKGALWNGGVFAFRLRYLIQLIKNYGYHTYTELIQHYSKLPKISFDYEVVEKTDSIAAVTYQGVWKDLGTWNTLTEVMSEPVVGPVYIDNVCENCHIINELQTPVVAMGLRNVVVAVSPDGILVSDKDQSSYLKPIVDQIHRRPMYEERRWGEYQVIDYAVHPGGMHSLTKRIKILAGKCVSYQVHQFRSEVWTITSGIGEFLLNGERKTVTVGDVMKIPIGAAHAIRAMEDLEFIEVQIGGELTEADITRLQMEW